jgi:hypothetical protein
LDIFAAGYPVSQQIACSDGASAREIEQTVTADGSSLGYDGATTPLPLEDQAVVGRHATSVDR